MLFSIYQNPESEKTARAEFYDSLPQRPRCTENYENGTKHQYKERAITFPYIEYNQPYQRYWLVFDIDHEQPISALYDAFLPLPAWIAQNNNNERAHVGYGLVDPVCTSPTARSAPVDYYNAVYRAMRDALGADPSYTEDLTKNPLHPRFRVDWLRSAHCGRYELSELAACVGIEQQTDQFVDDDTAALGRNSALFETLRIWAYKAIRQGWPEYPQWHEAVRQRAHGLNRFDPPLPFKEVDTIARSVAKRTHEYLSPAGFSAAQSVRGQKGGKRSQGGGRPKDSTSERQRMPWLELGISARTYNRRKKPKNSKG